jgi:hypothetical protein
MGYFHESPLKGKTIPFLRAGFKAIKEVDVSFYFQLQKLETLREYTTFFSYF